MTTATAGSATLATGPSRSLVAITARVWAVTPNTTFAPSRRANTNRRLVRTVCVPSIKVRPAATRRPAWPRSNLRSVREGALTPRPRPLSGKFLPPAWKPPRGVFFFPPPVAEQPFDDIYCCKSGWPDSPRAHLDGPLAPRGARRPCRRRQARASGRVSQRPLAGSRDNVVLDTWAQHHPEFHTPTTQWRESCPRKRPSFCEGCRPCLLSC